MKTISINVYSFSELSEKSQNKALNKLRDINTDYEWWMPTYEDFQQFAEYFGLTVDTEKTYFALSYSQGDGCSYTADVDPCKLIACLKDEAWKEYAPKEVIILPAVSRNVERVCKLIAAGKIDFTAYIKPANRETSIHVNCEWSHDDENINELKNISAACNELNDIIEETADRLNRWFFHQLQNEYEYQTSDDAIKETIAANDYLFFENGKLIPVHMYPKEETAAN